MKVICNIQNFIPIIILFMKQSSCQKCKECKIDVYFEESEFGQNYLNIITEELESLQNGTHWDIKWYNDPESFLEICFEEYKIHVSAATCKFNQFLLETLESSNATQSYTILISKGPCSRKMNMEDVQFIVLPEKSFQFSAALQLIQDLHDYGEIDWNTVSVIHDSDIDEEFLSLLLSNTHLFSRRKKLISRKVFKLPRKSDNIIDFVEEIFNNSNTKRTTEENFLVICDDSTILQNMLKVAEVTDYLNFNSQWLILSNNPYLMNNNWKEMFENSTTNMAIIYPAFELSNSPNINEYNTDIEQCHLRRILRHLTQTMNVNTEELCPTQGTYYIESHISKYLSKSYERKIELWTIEEGFLNKRHVALFPYMKPKMKNIELAVITAHNPPEQIITPSNCTAETNEYDCVFTGLSAYILTTLQQSLKFSYTLKIIESNDIIWNNTMKLFENKEANLGAISFVITKSRSKEADFTVAYDNLPYTILASNPKEIQDEFVVLEAMKLEVHVCLLIALAALSIIMYAMQSLQRISNDINDTHFSLQRYIFTLWGILLQQGMSMLPNCNSSRIIIAAWLLAATVITSTFTGNIVAFLTIPRFTKQIRNFDDLYNNNETVTWSYKELSSIRFQTTKELDKKLAYIYTRAEILKEVDDELWNRVRDKNHVILDTRPELVSMLHTRYDQTRILGEYALGDDLFYEGAAFAFPKRFPFLALFNKEIERMISTGLIDKFRKLSVDKNENRLQLKFKKAKKTISRQVSMANLKGPLYVLFLGYAIGLWAFFIEIFLHKLQSYRKRNVSHLV